jgi:hypothetical protein
MPVASQPALRLRLWGEAPALFGATTLALTEGIATGGRDAGGFHFPKGLRDLALFVELGIAALAPLRIPVAHVVLPGALTR